MNIINYKYINRLHFVPFIDNNCIIELISEESLNDIYNIFFSYFTKIKYYENLQSISFDKNFF